MSTKQTLRRAALAGAIALLLAGGVAAAPAETTSETTTLAVRTSTGQRETLDLPELFVGESRALSTRSGAAATVTRTESGITAWVAGETFEVPMPDRDDGLSVDEAVEREVDAAGGDGQAKKIVVVRKHRAADGSSPEIDIETIGDADDAAAILDAAPGKRVVLIKRVRKETDAGAVD